MISGVKVTARNAILATVLAVVVTGCGGQGSRPTAQAVSTTTRPPSTSTSRPARSSTTGASCAQEGLPTTVAYETVEGVARNLTSLDVHAPTSACGAPVVMWVHGGGYRVGDKSKQMTDKVRLFNEHGWILVSVNYRLTRPGDPTSARYPDHYRDVAAAVAWVHAHIGDYGGDPARIALLGHSAGADIVSNVVTNPTYLSATGLGLDAVSCAGPLDTEGFDKTTAGAADPDGEKEQWRSALANNPDYLTATSATALVERGIGIPPMIGVVRGTPQRQAIERRFLDTLAAAGVPATRIDARSLTHQQVNTGIGAPGDTVMTPPLIEFLEGCFQH